MIGPDELTDVFLQAGYYVFGWTAVADAFAAWIGKKDPKPLRALFDESNPQVAGSDNGYAIYLAVQCTDAQWPQSWTKWQRGQLADPPHGAVRDLGQRLVQRALPDLGRQGRQAGRR